MKKGLHLYICTPEMSTRHQLIKLEVYRQILEGIRQYCPDLVICLSTSGRNFNELDKEQRHLLLNLTWGL